MRRKVSNNLPRTIGMICTATLLLTGGTTSGHAATASHDSRFDLAVWTTLDSCESYRSCQDAVRNAKGVLVFPSLARDDLVLGGDGGKGALVQDGRITGYYSIGTGADGLQAGVDNANQVYALRQADTLDRLTSGQDWNVGATPGVAVDRADAAAATASVDAFIFDAGGLQPGASVNAFYVWKMGSPRPAL